MTEVPAEASILEPIGRTTDGQRLPVTPTGHLPARIDVTRNCNPRLETAIPIDPTVDDSTVFGDTRLCRLAALRGDPVFRLVVDNRELTIGIIIPNASKTPGINEIIAEIARRLGAEKPY